MLGMFVSNNGSVFIKGRSVKNKPIEQAVIHIGLSKRKYMRTVIRAYRSINFTHYDIIELSQMSLRQWVNRKYTIPKGYTLKKNEFKKLTQEDRIRNMFYHNKFDSKSNPIVK